jgi:flagellar basal-body rod modification protein FlgD
VVWTSVSRGPRHGYRHSSGTSVIDKINNSRNSLATNEQSFLKLLTTQLKNQDPLSPTDTNQMTSQITQMTGVEQQLVTNDLLAALVGMNTGSGLSEAVGMMDKLVTAETTTSTLKDKEGDLRLQSGRARRPRLTDRDHQRRRQGRPHDHARRHEERRPHLQVGRQGRQAASNCPTAASTPSRSRPRAPTARRSRRSPGRIQGIVTAVDNSTGQTMVTINGKQVAMDSVIGVTNPPAPVSADGQQQYQHRHGGRGLTVHPIEPGVRMTPTRLPRNGSCRAQTQTALNPPSHLTFNAGISS